MTGFLRDGDQVVGAEMVDTRTGEQRRVHAACVLNATGPWAGVVAGLLGLDVMIRLDRGAMVAMNIRWVNTVINRLRPPSDGDILVPVGTVCVLGTTSIRTEDPADKRVEVWEVSKILNEADPVVPGIRHGRRCARGRGFARSTTACRLAGRDGARRQPPFRGDRPHRARRAARLRDGCRR